MSEVRRLRIWLSVLVLIILGTGGCATVKRARAVQRGEDAVAGEHTVSAAQLGLTTNMVLDLEHALAIALEYHPMIAVARQQVIVASNQTKQVFSSFLPTIGAAGSYSTFTADNRSLPSSHGWQALGGLVKAARDAGEITPKAVQTWATEVGKPGESHSFEQYSAGINADLLIYDFGRTPAALRRAVAYQAAMDEQLRLACNEVAYNVRASFFKLANAQALLQVAEESERQYRTHLEQVQAFFDVGRRIRYDVTKAEVDVRNAELSVINARNALKNARAALNRSLGLAEDPPYTIEGASLTLDAHDLESFSLLARDRHPELGMLRAREQMASALVDLAIADLYPEFRLQAGYAGKDARLPILFNWSAALQGAINLFSGGRRLARIDEMVAELRSARAQVASREQQLYSDLNQACHLLEGAEQRLHVTGLLVKTATESLDLIEERYRVGSASSIEVTDAQVALTKARAEEVQAKYDREAAVAAIRYTIGDEW